MICSIRNFLLFLGCALSCSHLTAHQSSRYVPAACFDSSLASGAPCSHHHHLDPRSDSARRYLGAIFTPARTTRVPAQRRAAGTIPMLRDLNIVPQHTPSAYVLRTIARCDCDCRLLLPRTQLDARAPIGPTCCYLRNWPGHGSFVVQDQPSNYKWSTSLRRVLMASCYAIKSDPSSAFKTKRYSTRNGPSVTTKSRLSNYTHAGCKIQQQRAQEQDPFGEYKGCFARYTNHA